MAEDSVFDGVGNFYGNNKSKKEVKTMAKKEEIENNEQEEEEPKRGRTFGDPIAEVEF